MAGTHHHIENKREGQRKAKRHAACMNQGRKLIPLVVGSYFTHHPSNVACMHNVNDKAKVRHTPCVYMNQKLE
jgi:hypothetical protein